MTSEQRLRQLVTDLDEAARREIAVAASEGRFDELSSIVLLAKEIAALAARWSLGPPSTQPAMQIQNEPEPPSVENAIRGTSRAEQRQKKTDYPRFLREKQDLVKLGWSPREKGPYEHRVPKTGVDAVVAAVATRGKSGYRFAIAEIAKALAVTKGTDPVPSYQIYAVVSWLKWAGMILQHGRQGYTVVRPQTFASSIETAWQSLSQR